ncbi:MAG: YhgE/Pip domain-containing protein [Clostridiales bacterium]|nr:YhgE/Pip domain-containing protein [Clostridiales bacterium]
MKFSEMFLQGVRNSISSRFRIISIVAILIVPVLYPLFYLQAFWDPYANLDKLPVAFVNEDNGYSGENYGEKLATDLKKSEAVDWQFVNRAKGDAGLSDKTYYAEFVIPADFSKKMQSGNSDVPQASMIELYTNSKNSFMASLLSENVDKQIRAELAGQIAGATVGALVDTLAKNADDLNAGASDLKSSGETLTDAGGQLKTDALTDGAQKLRQNGADLVSGGAQLDTNALRQGGTSLTDGASKLDTAALEKAGAQLKAGAFALDSASLKAAGTQLTAGAAQLDSASLQTSAAQLAALAGSLAQSAQAAGLPDAAQLTQLAAGAAQLNAGVDTYTGGADTLKSELGAYVSGADTYAAGVESLKSGLNTYVSGADTYADGADSLKSGVNSYVAGVNTFAGGADSLKSGVNTYVAGANTFVSGALALQDGASAYADGVEAYVSGADKLADGVNTFQSGVTSLQGRGLKTYLTDPVQATQTDLSDVPNYGTGFAPYFCSLALWIGALLTALVIPAALAKKDGNEEGERLPAEPASGGGGPLRPTRAFNLVVPHYLLCAGIGILQAALLVVVIFGLGIHVASWPWLFVVFVMTALTSSAIITTLVGLLGRVGQLLSMIILIFQLTASAGTFPLQLSGAQMFTTLHPFVTFTYSIDALREVISGRPPDLAVVGHSLLVLGCVVIGFLALRVLLTPRMISLKSRGEIEAI